MAPRLTGRMFTYETHVLYVGPVIATARHAHHAGQVMWAPDGLLVEDDGAERQVTTFVVPPHAPHRHGTAEVAAVLWVDRDDLPWESAMRGSRPFIAPAGLTLGDSLTSGHARDLARALLELVAPRQEARVALHPAVKRMCALLDSVACERDLRVTELAGQSGLSVRQLRHCFTEELGVNPRAYLRWRRLRRAFEAMERGATLTEAATEGGFADGAHLSRVWQAQFGMAPSQALSSVEFAGTLG